jgi:hypothetical protein
MGGIGGGATLVPVQAVELSSNRIANAFFFMALIFWLDYKGVGLS